MKLKGETAVSGKKSHFCYSKMSILSMATVLDGLVVHVMGLVDINEFCPLFLGLIFLIFCVLSPIVGTLRQRTLSKQVDV